MQFIMFLLITRSPPTVCCDCVLPRWYHEVNSQWPGIACSIECEEILHDERSKYQHVQVFKSKTFGNVLILDGEPHLCCQVAWLADCKYNQGRRQC